MSTQLTNVLSEFPGVRPDRSEPSRIIVIDDNESIHKDFKKILSSSEAGNALDQQEALLFGDEMATSSAPTYIVEAAPQGKDGRDMVAAAMERNQPYAMAFVDMRMPPGWDGVQTIEELWKVDPELQVVICSAYSDYAWHEITDRLGQTDRLLILKKPFDNVEVSQLAMALTEKWHISRQVQRQMASLEEAVSQRTNSLNKAIDALEASHQFLDSAIDSLSSRIVILDGAGNAITTNAQWRDTVDENALTPPELVVGESYLDAIDGLEMDSCGLKEGIEQVLAGELTTFHGEYSYLSEGGQNSWCSASVSQFQNGTSTRVVVAHNDVTVLKSLQGQLAHAQKLEAVGQLAAGVAHEINTPIQYIGDNIRFLQDSFRDIQAVLQCTNEYVNGSESENATSDLVARLRGQVKEADVEYLSEEIPVAITQSIDGVERVAKIVRAMKEFSHPGQEGKSQVDLNHSLQSTTDVAANEWKYVADLKMDLDPNLPPVPCLPSELNQVFLNLLVNAAHAIEDKLGEDSGEKGTITISTAVEGDYAVVCIGDSGTGIPERCRDKIFDPFFTTKGVGKGTGQGLSIAHSIITEAHGGRIRFDTEAGQGTTFIIELPLK